MDVAMQSVVGVAMVPEAILEKLEPMYEDINDNEVHLYKQNLSF